MTLNIFIVSLIALAAAIIFCRAMIAVGLMDSPINARKREAQKSAVPSSGGVGFLAAIPVGLACVPASPFNDPALLGLSVGALAMMLVGLSDDLWDINAKIKLGLQLAICVAIVFSGVYIESLEPGFGKIRTFGPVIGGVLALCWMLLLVNAVNFMDGANGVSMGMAMFASMGFCAITAFIGEWEIALAAAGLTGALLGFLIWNVAGKLFAGDAGSLAVGVLLAGFSILLIKARPDFVWIPPILLSPFLVDVLLTLNYRVKKGENFWEAHSQHVYQLGLKPPLLLKHWQVAVGHWMIAANCAALAFAGAIIGYEAPLVIFIGVALLGCWMHVRIRRAAIAVGMLDVPKATSEIQDAAE